MRSSGFAHSELAAWLIQGALGADIRYQSLRGANQWGKWVRSQLQLALDIVDTARAKQQTSNWQGWQEAERDWSRRRRDLQAEREMDYGGVLHQFALHEMFYVQDKARINVLVACVARRAAALACCSAGCVLAWRALLIPLHAQNSLDHMTNVLFLCSKQLVHAPGQFANCRARKAASLSREGKERCLEILFKEGNHQVPQALLPRSAAHAQ